MNWYDFQDKLTLRCLNAWLNVSNKVWLFAILAVLGSRSHSWSYFTLLPLLLETILPFHEVVLHLLVIVAIIHAHVVLVLNVLNLGILIYLRWCLVMHCARVPMLVSMHHILRHVRALAMWVEVIVVPIVVSISMGWMLELTDDILLVGCCIARAHLVLVLVHHLLHDMILTILAVIHIHWDLPFWWFDIITIYSFLHSHVILILGLVIPLSCIIRLDIDVIHILIALVHHDWILPLGLVTKLQRS